MLEPLVSRLVLAGDGHGTALLRSASTTAERARVQVAGTGPARVTTYDGRGQLVAQSVSTARTVTVTVPAGGFALVRR
jgi:phosphoribosylaminoimidazole carboxylase (NCAIR synthetase)